MRTFKFAVKPVFQEQKVEIATTMDKAIRRLKQLQVTLQTDPTIISGGSHSSLSEDPIIILPDGSKIYITHQSNGSHLISINGKEVLYYQSLATYTSLVLSAVGTPFENDDLTDIPKYAILQLTNACNTHISLSDIWACIYALWIIYHEQEQVPVELHPSIPNYNEIIEYLLCSGLGRQRLAVQKVPDAAFDVVYMIRETFWQGAGTGAVWRNERGWLRGDYTDRISTFPRTESFTRNSLVISAHPLRPPKPKYGECIYRRYCTPVKKMLSFHVFDPSSELHIKMLHRWLNNKHVHKGWGRGGTLEDHIWHVRKQNEDPHVLPIMMSWDDEPMGYIEIYWVKEDHIATYIPNGCLDYDRGIHVLCGEEGFLGDNYSRAWTRSVSHYIFLADLRTVRIFGGPRKENNAIIKAAEKAGMRLHTTFDFSHMRSEMVMLLREQVFKNDML